VKPRLAVAALASTLVVWACGPSPDTAPLRLLQSIPAERYHATEHAVEEAFHWSFATDADLAPWSVTATISAELSDGALWLAAADTSSLTRASDLAASDVASIVARVAGLRMGRARLSWAGPGEELSAERSIALTGDGSMEAPFDFPVAQHPAWHGTIARLRLDITANPGERIGIRSISGVRAHPLLDAQMLERPWRIEIDDELRAGFVLSGGSSHTWALPDHRRAELRFAVGLLEPPATGDATFSIARVGGDGPSTEIFVRAIPARERPRWIAATAQLAPGGGAESELEFRLECPSSERCAGAFAAVEARPPHPAARPNVVLISIDTLRADRMSLYGNPRPTTESIDRWARRLGVTFEQVVAQAPWTLPSHVSMLTGLNATSHGVNYHTSAPPDLEMLAERLRTRGYFTAAVTGGGYLSPEFGFWQGFAVYRSWERDVARYWDDEAPADDELAAGVSHALDLLREAGDRPFFLLFHTYEVHGPYRQHEPYFTRFLDGPAPGADTAVGSERLPPEEENGFRVSRRLVRMPSGGDPVALPGDETPLALALYDSGVASMDAQVGGLLAQLEAMGLMEDTIVVLTSDHGEMLGELGLGGHVYLHPANLRVPLVFSWPAGFSGGRRIEQQVRSIDIVSTLLELIDGESREIGDGISLAPLLAGEPDARTVPPAVAYAASSNRGLALRIDNRLQYIYDDTLWRSGSSGEVVAPDAQSAALPAGDLLISLRRSAENLLDARDGLHLVLVNRGAGEFRLQLDGPMVQRNRLKATGLECRCARWLGGSSAEVRIPEGSRFDIRIEDPQEGTLALALQADGASYRKEIDVGALDEALAVELTAAGWRETNPASSDPQRGLMLRWQGASRLSSGVPLDEDLLRQLRALGYLR